MDTDGTGAAPYFGMYGNNVLSPRYIVTSPPDSHLSHVTFSPQPAVQQPNLSSGSSSSSNTSWNLNLPPYSLSPNSVYSEPPTYYQIQPPAAGEMVIVRTTTITRNTISIQPLHSTF